MFYYSNYICTITYWQYPQALYLQLTCAMKQISYINCYFYYGQGGREGGSLMA